MMQTWQVILKEFNSETWILKNFSLKSFMIIFFYMFALLFLGFGLQLVHSALVFPFLIFNFMFSAYFMQESKTNAGFKNYQSLQLIINKPKNVIGYNINPTKRVPTCSLTIDKEMQIVTELLKRKIDKYDNKE